MKEFNEKNLIFLVSLPRSGSTLLQSLLANSPLIATTSEPWILLPFLSILDSTHTTYDFDINLAKTGINEFTNRKKIDLNKIIKQSILKIYSHYIDNNQKFFLDKTPRYYLIIDQILQLFPESKLIILLRNPIDVLYSIITTWTRLDINKLLKLKIDILKAPFILKNAIEKYQNLNNVLVVKYENIIRNTNNELKKIFSFLKLETPKTLNKINVKAIRGTMGDKKIYNTTEVIQDNFNKWQKVKDKKIKQFLLAYIDYLGKDLLEYFGYDWFNFKNTKSKEFNFFLKAAKFEFESIKKTPIKFFIETKIFSKFNIII